MSNETTQYTPADVRERVKEPTQAQIDDACLWYRHDFGLLSEKERDSVRFEARQWFRAWGKALSNGDDPAALLRTPRGDGEDTIPVSALRSEIAQLRAHRLLPYLAWARLCALAGGEPVGEDNPAARRSDAQGEKEDALDLIRWAESHHAALEPVVGNIMPPGTYACYVGDDDDPYMGPGILGAIRAARRSEAPGDGPVGAVCANCGDPNAAIAGGELDPDEAVCSVECYEQLMELGCPQAHGGTYRPKPARRGEGGGDGE